MGTQPKQVSRAGEKVPKSITDSLLNSEVDRRGRNGSSRRSLTVRGRRVFDKRSPVCLTFSQKPIRFSREMEGGGTLHCSLQFEFDRGKRTMFLRNVSMDTEGEHSPRDMADAFRQLLCELAGSRGATTVMVNTVRTELWGFLRLAGFHTLDLRTARLRVDEQ